MVAWLNRLSDETIIEFLDGLKKSRSKDDWWDELTEEQQTLIQAGIDDVEKGNVISSSDFWKALKRTQKI